ncbi:hypothetical protein BU52_28855 [Streptomyces toyocaensis]|uniref:N-acetyltransferase domain-containing protein n=1 Tax=Streptomyces toyocaensis TaxID=55952 RepID=A0A081XJK4_STRTO|nr:hypothetical protein BU52_28855 [Streptomyces toyocaensis]
MNLTSDPLRRVVSAYAAAAADLATVTSGRTRRSPGGSVLAISGAPVARLNAVISPSPEPSAEEIGSLAAAEGPWELPWSIHVRGMPGPSVAEWAAGHGLTHYAREPLMIRPAELGMPEKPVVDSLRVRAVSGDEIGLYTATIAAGFQASSDAFRLLANPALTKIDGVTFYLADVDGIPVGTGMAAISGDLTGIYNITTLPGHRRRGYGRALTIELTRAGFAAGARTAYLYASTMGEPIYASIGFRVEEYLTLIVAPPRRCQGVPPLRHRLPPETAGCLVDGAGHSRAAAPRLWARCTHEVRAGRGHLPGWRPARLHPRLPGRGHGGQHRVAQVGAGHGGRPGRPGGAGGPGP